MGKIEKVQYVQNAGCDSAASQLCSAAPRQNSKAPKATKVQLLSKKTLITCFKCKKEGHHVRDCTLKKEKKGMSKIQEKKMAHVKCSNMGYNASMCSNKVDDQATLQRRRQEESKGSVMNVMRRVMKLYHVPS
jgi:predicted nucleic-acid-binding Zn-ribbon protein